MAESFLKSILKVIVDTLLTCMRMPDALGYRTASLKWNTMKQLQRLTSDKLRRHVCLSWLFRPIFASRGPWFKPNVCSRERFSSCPWPLLILESWRLGCSNAIHTFPPVHAPIIQVEIIFFVQTSCSAHTPNTYNYCCFLSTKKSFLRNSRSLEGKVV